MPIRSLNWSLPSPGLVHWWGPAGGTLLAIWPSPINGDACFTKAGFTDFDDDDLDEAWDADFENLTSSLVRRLSSFGTTVLRYGSSVLQTDQTIEEALLETTGKDTQICVPPCIVDFGDPPRASLCTSDEHRIWWVKISDGLVGVEAFLQELAGLRPLVRRDIDFAILAPSPDHPALELKHRRDHETALYGARANRRVKIIVGIVAAIFILIVFASLIKRL